MDVLNIRGDRINAEYSKIREVCCIRNYADTSEMKSGAYFREYNALCSFIKIRGNKK